MFFSFFALAVSFLTLFSRAGVYSIVELSFLWVVTYVVVRYVIFKLFARFSVHRGVFHSLLAAIFFGLLTTSLTYHLFRLNALGAWMSGLFVCVVFVIYLVFDALLFVV